jgi:hypothetical protein
MQILVLIGSSVSEVGQVKVRHFPFKRYMAYNNLHSTTVHAVIGKFKFQFKQNMPRVATNVAKMNSPTFTRIPVEYFAYFPDYLRQCKIMAFQIDAFITVYA